MSVTIKEYSSKLIERFSQEKYRLSKFLPNDIKIEHVGSSSIPIGGKNIIDILVGVPKHEDMISVKNILTKNGYFEGTDFDRKKYKHLKSAYVSKLLAEAKRLRHLS